MASRENLKSGQCSFSMNRVLKPKEIFLAKPARIAERFLAHNFFLWYGVISSYFDEYWWSEFTQGKKSLTAYHFLPRLLNGNSAALINCSPHFKMADNRPRVTSAREAIEGMYIAFEGFDCLVGKRFSVWYGLNIFQMCNILKKLWLKLFFYTYIKTLDPL